jgi:hypothetical protein
MEFHNQWQNPDGNRLRYGALPASAYGNGIKDAAKGPTVAKTLHGRYP